MCNVSMIFDTYKPHLPDPNAYPWPQPGTAVPWPIAPAPRVGEWPTPTALRELLESFRQAVEAAKAFDRLTNQPDCEDPEKAKLLDRVDELERRLDELEAR